MQGQINLVAFKSGIICMKEGNVYALMPTKIRYKKMFNEVPTYSIPNSAPPRGTI